MLSDQTPRNYVIISTATTWTWEQLNFGNLHTARAVVHRRENQTVSQIRSRVVEEDVVGVESGWEVSHITRRNLGEILAVVGTLQQVSHWVTIRRIIRRLQGHTNDFGQPNRRSHSESSVVDVEVQIFGVGIINRIANAF